MKKKTTPKTETIPIGKLPPEQLAHMLKTYARPDPRVVVGASLGEDAAVIDFGDRYLVAKSDPITFATDRIGWYAVNVNANDVACTGAAPRWFLATLLLPEKGTDAALVEDIFSQIASACDALGVTLCGGHTEVTYGLDRPVIAGHMLGEVQPGRFVSTSGVQVGDAIILTKGIAIEGTAIIADEIDGLLSGRFGDEYLERCRRFLVEPGISVVADARAAMGVGEVHAMHDPTEGGLAMGLWEMSQASGVGMEIYEEDIPVFPETRELCAALGLEPMGLIASGALLVAASTETADDVVRSLRDEGIAAGIIGRAIPGDGCLLASKRGEKKDEKGEKRPMPHYHRDEITKLFE